MSYRISARETLTHNALCAPLLLIDTNPNFISLLLIQTGVINFVTRYLNFSPGNPLHVIDLGGSVAEWFRALVL